jgi:L-alanine-DL-glutamate epimerase-like enolase superfamily enzyme
MRNEDQAAAMKIERIEVRVTDLPVRLKRLRSQGVYDTGASGTSLGKPLLVKVYAEGVVGYGQIRPLTPHHSMADTYGSIITAICDLYGPRLIGMPLANLEQLHTVFDHAAPANFNARALLDHAIHDALGKQLGCPVHDLIGGLCQDNIPLEWSVSMSEQPGKMVEDSQRALDEFGIRVLCLKAGHPEGWRRDVQNFLEVRRAMGEDIVIGMDPNTGWTVSETLRVLDTLKDARIDYLEQPVARHDLAGMAMIRRAANGVPLMADEACGSLADAHAIIAAQAADVLCIKLYKHGGITPARKIAAVAEAANVKINCGGLAVLSQLEAAAGAHFYASRASRHVMPAGEFIFALGVMGPDPLVPHSDFVVRDGHVRIPSSPGLGIQVDEQAVQRLTLREESVS